MKKPTNLFKRAAIALMAASIVAATPAVASAAWETSGKGWNWIVNGQKATGWQWIDSQWYFMDTDGTMKTGWVQDGGSWYYLAPSGEMKTGWAQVGGTWYYLKSSGAMATGWVSWNGSWYRMNTSGAMITGWTSWDGGWYYMAPAGDMATGVIKVDGATYAMDASGKMQTGEVTVAGKTYTFGEDGAAVGDAPEAARTFVSGPSGASETTTGGTGGSGTTTPAKPSRPSTGGGYTPSDPDTPVTPTSKRDITLKSNADATNEATYPHTEEYNNVYIEAWGTEDLSWIRAEKVYIRAADIASPASARAGALTVTLSNTAKQVFVETAVVVDTSTSNLPYVEVKANGVTVPAAGTLVVSTTDVADATVTLTGNVGTLTVNAGAKTTVTGSDVTVTNLTAGTATVVNVPTTGTVTANANVTVSANANTVTATGEATVTVSGTGTTVGSVSAAKSVTVNDTATVGKVTATANNVTVDGNSSNGVGTVEAGTNAVTVSVPADKVTATTGKVTLETGATVAELTTGGDVDVKGNAAVNTIIPNGTDQNIDMADPAKVTTILAAEDAVNVTVGGQEPASGALDGKFKESVDAPDETKGDYTLEDAIATSPEEGSITPSTEVDALDIEILVDGTWTPVSGKMELAPGKHSIRFNDVDSSKMSESTEITIGAYTGFGSGGAFDGKYYENSTHQDTKTGWVVDPNATTDTYWVASGIKAGAKSWQRTNSQPANEENWTYVDADCKKTAATFVGTGIAAAENEMAITGLTAGMRVKAPGAGTDAWVTLQTEDSEAEGYITGGKLVVTAPGEYTIANATTVNAVAIDSAAIATITREVKLPKADAPSASSVTPANASADSPTQGTLTASVAGLQYALKPAEGAPEENAWKSLTKDQATPVDPGTYVIRTAAVEGKKSASDPVALTNPVAAFTGEASAAAAEGEKGKYYIDSKLATAGWHTVTETGTETEKDVHITNNAITKNAWVDENVQSPTKACFLGAEGTITATFDPSKVTVSDEGALNYADALTGTDTTKKLYTKTEDTENPYAIFDAEAFKAAETGKIEVYAGVTVTIEGKDTIIPSEIKASITKPAATEPEETE